MTAYFRHILDRREAIRWNHCNLALQYPFRLIIDDEVARAAVAAGHDCWLIFHKDEKLLATYRDLPGIEAPGIGTYFLPRPVRTASSRENAHCRHDSAAGDVVRQNGVRGGI